MTVPTSDQSSAPSVRMDLRRRAHAYYGEIPQTEMQALLAKLREGVNKSRAAQSDHPPAAQQAFARTLAAHGNQHLYDYACDPSRADWLELFLTPPGARALDYGAGLGNFALRLAARGGEVWAADATPERLDFIALRAEALAGDTGMLNNVRTILADEPAALPFEPASFDFILLNGVLEWTAVGQSSKSKSPEKVHREFLRALGRLLSPGGSLVVAIENRWSLFHFFGAREHNDFRFAPLLPRRIATWISQRRRGAPYETYTYSAAALRRLASEAGMETARAYWAFPSYQQARLVIDSTTPPWPLAHLLAQQLPARSRRWRWLRRALVLIARLGLMPALAPALIVQLKPQDPSQEMPRGE